MRNSDRSHALDASNVEQHELEPIDDAMEQQHERCDEETERTLLTRLDRRLLLFAMLGNTIKTLDNTNLGNAYISGMEEELNIQGTQYNWMSVLFMIGYLVMQIPSNILLSKLRPSRYLPLLEVIWCIITFSMACVRSVYAVYCLRLMLGLAEAGFLPGIMFLIGTWYTKKEMGKRAALVTIFGSLGAGLSGLVQAVLLKTVDGVLGISGWRWMFVVDATFTLALAIFGYKNMPDYPHNTRWLSEKERRLAVHRMNEEGRETKQDIWNAKVLRDMVSNVYVYLLVIGWTTLHLAIGAAHVLGIVAKRLGYDSVTANLLTSPDMFISMLLGLLNGFLSDYFRNRLWCILVPDFLGLVGCSMLMAFVQPFGVLYFAFVLTHASLAASAPIIMTWASEIMAKNIESRALVIATMNTSSSAMYIWAPLVLWPVTDAPYYSRGFTASVGFVAGSIACFACIGYLRRRDKKVSKTDSVEYSLLQEDVANGNLIEALPLEGRQSIESVSTTSRLSMTRSRTPDPEKRLLTRDSFS